ncbi:ABC transporter permease [Rathayibacter sp. KR2-224]|uniref:ABC transporter permease n=1 Tax=Rathayibacter sp. KR2-224 TaxID=3400913 RepID=UPI003C090865
MLAIPRLRAAFRIATRQVLRSRGTSALVACLIALPIASTSGGLVFFASHQPTPQQEARMLLGNTEALITPLSAPDPTRVQYIDGLGAASAGPARGHRPTALPAAVPSSAHVVTLLPSVAEVTTATGVGQVPVIEGPAWDPALTGVYKRTGRGPSSANEAMVSPHLLERLGVKTGDPVHLAHGGASFTITGTLAASQDPTQDQLFVPAGALPVDHTGSAPTWYVTGWQPDYVQFTRLVRSGYGVLARDLVLEPPFGAPTTQITSYQTTFILLGAGGLFLATLVALLAGAAMSVSARRQQRSLAMAASVGAARGDLFRVVLLQGSILGVAGAVLGIGSGIGLAALALASTDHGEPWSFWRGNYGLHIPVSLILGIAAFAVAVGIGAAFFPALSATRGDTLSALRGARRPVQLSRAMPRWGVLLLVVGVLLSAASLGYGPYLRSASTSQHVHSLTDQLTFAVLVSAGPIALLAGTMMSGHWLLIGLGRLCSRAGVAARLASRDTAANPSRVVPAAGSIAISVCIATLALALASAAGAANAREYGWAGPLGSAVVRLNPGLQPATAPEDGILVAAASHVVRDAGATHVAVVEAPVFPSYDAKTGRLLEPDRPIFSAGVACTSECSSAVGGWSAYGQIAVVDAHDLGTAAGLRLDSSELQQYVGGSAIVADASETRNGKVAVLRSRAGNTTKSLAGPSASAILPALVRSYAYGNATMLLAPETARRMHIETRPDAVVAHFPTPPSVAQEDAMRAAAEEVFVGDGELYLVVERGPASVLPWLAFIAGVAGVLVVGASAICLGLSRVERRLDDTTLAAVGGTTRVRRWINVLQGAIISGGGSVVGALIGVAPAVAVTLFSSSWRAEDVPWPLIAGLALALPLLIAAASWIARPHNPNLVRRTAVS